MRTFPFVIFGCRSVLVGFFPCPMMTSSNGNIIRVTGPLCGEFAGPGKFPAQRSVTRSFDVFFDLHLNKRLSKQPWGWWFETPSWSLWRQCNARDYCSNTGAIGVLLTYTTMVSWPHNMVELSLWFSVCNLRSTQSMYIEYWLPGSLILLL